MGEARTVSRAGIDIEGLIAHVRRELAARKKDSDAVISTNTELAALYGNGMNNKAISYHVTNNLTEQEAHRRRSYIAAATGNRRWNGNQSVSMTGLRVDEMIAYLKSEVDTYRVNPIAPILSNEEVLERFGAPDAAPSAINYYIRARLGVDYAADRGRALHQNNEKNFFSGHDRKELLAYRSRQIREVTARHTAKDRGRQGRNSLKNMRRGYFDDGVKFQSAAEAACARVLKHFVPDFKIVPKETFQVRVARYATIDFLVPLEEPTFIEYHPIRLFPFGDSGDFPDQDALQMYRQTRSSLDSADRLRYDAETIDTLLEQYQYRRQESVDSNERYAGTQVIAVDSPARLYRSVFAPTDFTSVSEKDFVLFFERSRRALLESARRLASQ